MEGNQEFDAAAAELDVPFKRTGKLIAGFTDEDRQLLENFKARGEANGVKGLEIIDRKRMDELDPSAGGNFAMWCPASGILDPFLYTIALAENAVRNGVEYHLNCAFTGETKQADGTHLLHTTRGDQFFPLAFSQFIFLGRTRGPQLRRGQHPAGHPRLRDQAREGRVLRAG